jgi:hypothetical protein
MSGGAYTWSNKQREPTLEKLDRVLMSSDWEDIFPLVQVRKLVSELSDHCPLLLMSGEIDGSLKRNREFRFDISWLKNKDFLPQVEKIWKMPVNTMDPIDIMNIKLKRFKKHFKGWGSNLFGHIRKRKKELKEELAFLESKEEYDALSSEDFIRKTEVLIELQKIYADEELFWLQRSHERWLLEGDQNTAYFHRVTNGRRRKNLIHVLKDGNVNIEGTKNLLKHATDYYKSLFGPAPGNLLHLDESLWSSDENLNENDNLDLTGPFTVEEI